MVYVENGYFLKGFMNFFNISSEENRYVYSLLLFNILDNLNE